MPPPLPSLLLLLLLLQTMMPADKNSPLGTLKFLMAENGMKQKDVVEIFGSQGIASEVLNGKRSISKAHAKKLAELFCDSAELFI